jgi:hypothetical protein
MKTTRRQRDTERFHLIGVWPMIFRGPLPARVAVALNGAI